MKVVKPMSLGLLYCTFEQRGRFYLSVAALGYFDFRRPGRLLGEPAMWRAWAEEVGSDTVLDEGMPKPEAEVLVSGYAFAPPGDKATVVRVRLQLGSVDKTLWAIGDRVWRPNGVASDPQPFERMPVTWERAFGGEGFELNRAGRGLGAELPNIEDPRHLLRSQGDRPAPAGFDAIDRGHPERARWLGTYDQQWLDERAPGEPDDFDMHYYCVAPPDQRLAQLVGDEAFVIEGMHPERRRVEGVLPCVRARCFVRRKGSEALEEVSLGPDTVRLIPHLERGIVMYRGVTEVEEDDAFDVALMLLGVEGLSAERPVEHYASALERRLDPEQGALVALSDRGLIPDAMMDDEGTLPRVSNVAADRMQGRADRELARLREQLVEAGIDPDDHGVPAVLSPPAAPEPLTSLHALPEYLDRQQRRIEEARAAGEKQLDDAEDQLRQLCRAQGIDYDELKAERAAENVGPPAFCAEEQYQKLLDQLELARNAGVSLPNVDAQLADTSTLDRLRQVETQLFEVYRRFGHHQGPAPRLEGEAARVLRDRVAAAVAAGESMAGWDLTGADLSRVSLRGVDLRRALLESANLEAADLSDADLSDAMLARTNLSEAKLEGARLERANLAKSTVRHANLTAAKLTEAVLSEADMSAGCLRNAHLTGAELTGIILEDADLSGVIAKDVRWMAARLSRARLASADLERSLWIEIEASQLDLSDADLSGATFVACRIEEAAAQRTLWNNARLVSGTSLRRSDLRGAHLEESCLRQADLSGCDLSHAHLDRADLGECNFDGATLYRAQAHAAHLVRARLRGASAVSLKASEALLGNADLRDADFTGANLFRADLMRVRLSRRTRFKDALLEHIRFFERKNP